MANKGAVEAMDKSLRYLISWKKCMSCLTVLLSRDYRHIHSVVPRETRAHKVKL